MPAPEVHDTRAAVGDGSWACSRCGRGTWCRVPCHLLSSPAPAPPQAFDSLNYPYLALMGVDVQWNTRAMLSVRPIAHLLPPGGLGAAALLFHTPGPARKPGHQLECTPPA